LITRERRVSVEHGMGFVTKKRDKRQRGFINSTCRGLISCCCNLDKRSQTRSVSTLYAVPDWHSNKTCSLDNDDDKAAGEAAQVPPQHVVAARTRNTRALIDASPPQTEFNIHEGGSTSIPATTD
ncbi:unnamed protein product, partial [Ectocarpus sp. 4 AP-2014]